MTAKFLSPREVSKNTSTSAVITSPYSWISYLWPNFVIFNSLRDFFSGRWQRGFRLEDTGTEQQQQQYKENSSTKVIIYRSHRLVALVVWRISSVLGVTTALPLNGSKRQSSWWANNTPNGSDNWTFGQWRPTSECSQKATRVQPGRNHDIFDGRSFERSKWYQVKCKYQS